MISSSWLIALSTNGGSTSDDGKANLKKLAAWHASNPWRMLGIMVVVTVILAGLAGQLKVSTHTSDLLPEGDPKVVQYNNILDELITATSLGVVV